VPLLKGRFLETIRHRGGVKKALKSAIDRIANLDLEKSLGLVLSEKEIENIEDLSIIENNNHVLNINPEVYEAAYIDGMKNRFQEIFYITIPMMKPQMLFGAVMAIVGTFNSGAIGVQLTGSNPTPQYAGQLIVNHIDYYGFTKYEM
jgi:hypothetical protein